MNNNNKPKEITVTTGQSEFPAAPRLVLNDIDKIYLATAVKSVDKLTFIYTLVCHGENRQYEMVPRTEIAAFTNQRDANIYYRTVNQIMDFQAKMKGVDMIKQSSQKYIDDFQRRTR